MLVLAYLMQTSLTWRGTEIRLKLLVSREEGVESARHNIGELIQQLRIHVTPEVVIQDGQTLETLAPTTSAKADLVFLGLDRPDANFVEKYEALQC